MQTSILPGSTSSAVLLLLLMQVFDVRLEVELKVHVDDHKFIVRSEIAEQVAEAARNVFEELEEQMNMRSMKLSFNSEGTERKGQGTVHEQVHDERHERMVEKFLLRLAVRNTQVTM